MSPKRRVVMGGLSKPERLSAESSDLSAPPSWQLAPRWFFNLAISNKWALGADIFMVDGLVSQAIHWAWNEGEARALVGDPISGLQQIILALRGSLHSSWRLWGAWGRKELPSRADPISFKTCCALACVMWQWQCQDAALSRASAHRRMPHSYQVAVSIQRIGHVLRAQLTRDKGYVSQRCGRGSVAHWHNPGLGPLTVVSRSTARRPAASKVSQPVQNSLQGSLP